MGLLNHKSSKMKIHLHAYLYHLKGKHIKTDY